MTDVEMRDTLGNAMAKLTVLFSLFASDQADLNACSDGLTLITDNVFADVAEVLESLESEAEMEKAKAE